MRQVLKTDGTYCASQNIVIPKCIVIPNEVRHLLSADTTDSSRPKVGASE
jgi:hypothetical protein